MRDLKKKGTDIETKRHRLFHNEVSSGVKSNASTAYYESSSSDEADCIGGTFSIIILSSDWLTSNSWKRHNSKKCEEKDNMGILTQLISLRTKVEVVFKPTSPLQNSLISSGVAVSPACNLIKIIFRSDKGDSKHKDVSAIMMPMLPAQYIKRRLFRTSSQSEYRIGK